MARGYDQGRPDWLGFRETSQPIQVYAYPWPFH
jgi:hypothetical protein